MGFTGAAADLIAEAVAAGRWTPLSAAQTPADAPAPPELTLPLTLTIEGLRVYSEGNRRDGHWAARHRRNRGQQDLVRAALARIDPAALRALPRLRVTLTRLYGPRGRPFDRDGLWSSMKHCIDAIAAHVGVDDGDPWWIWVVDPAQVKGREYGVKICLEKLWVTTSSS